jgi:hypothetical protein
MALDRLAIDHRAIDASTPTRPMRAAGIVYVARLGLLQR